MAIGSQPLHPLHPLHPLQVTAILYLNGDWQPADGGCLRIYGAAIAAHPEAQEGSAENGQPAERYVEVQPRRGTLALFWSHRCGSAAKIVRW